MTRYLLTSFILLITCYAFGGDIVVHEGESLHDALRQAREWRRTHDPRCEGGITITLEEGRYYMQEPLFLRPEDSGTKESPLVIRGSGTLKSFICGDARQRHTQLWPLKEQGDSLPLSKYDDGLPKKGMERMIDFNTTDRTITIPTPPQNVLQTKNLEMVVHQRWAIAILRVKEMKVDSDKTIVSFMEPESRLEFEHPWPQPVIGGEKGNSSFLLRTTEQRDGVEQLVVVDGAKFVRFEGLTFENTCWNRPLHKGHVTLQGGFPLLDAYKLAVPGLPWDPDLENQAWIERPVSAVTVRNAKQISFTKCLFQHLGGTALDIESIDGGKIGRCFFEDIGGTAIMAGSFAESPLEVHRPYQHLAERCQRFTIEGNSIYDAANEDWGAVGIALGYVCRCTVNNNFVGRVNYSGICVGWGWTPHNTGMSENVIEDNMVSDYARQLYDAGGIYTLSNQPNSSIRDNRISQPYPAPYATNDRAFPIYLDARTDGFTIEDNMIAVFNDTTTDICRPIRREEIGDNHPGPNIIFKQ